MRRRPQAGLQLEQKARTRDGLSLVPWSTPFEEPIVLPNGRKLITLKDAGDYITRLPKADTAPRNGRPRWKANPAHI